MDAAALILRRCKVSPIRAALAHYQVLQRLKVEIQSKTAKIINAAEITIHHCNILCGKGKKRIIYKCGRLGCTREKESDKKGIYHWYAKDNKSGPAGCVLTYIICFCVCGEYAVNKKEYGSLKKKAQLQRKFPEPVASWLQQAKLGQYGFHQYPNMSSGPAKEELHLDPEVIGFICRDLKKRWPVIIQ